MQREVRRVVGLNLGLCLVSPLLWSPLLMHLPLHAHTHTHKRLEKYDCIMKDTTKNWMLCVCVCVPCRWKS